MIIAQLVQRFNPGGLETMVLALGQHLSQQHQLHYFSLEGSTEQLKDEWPLLRQFKHVHGLGKTSGLDWQLPQRLRQQLRQQQVQCLHSHHIGPLLYGALACAGASPIVQLHTHHDAWHLRQPKARWLTRLALATSGATSVANADNVAQQLQALGCGVDAVVLNRVDTNRFCPADKAQARQQLQLQLPQQAWLFGAVARLVPVKQLQLLVQALVSLPPSAQLVLAGDGPCRQSLQQLAQQLKVASRCHFLGHHDQPELVYQALDQYCLCSADEGAPMALWEAQSCGLPVLCADVGSCAQLLCPSSSRLLTAAESWSAALQQAHQTATQHRLAAAQQQAARAFALASGGLEAMASEYQHQYQHHYQQLLAEG
ncbi:glycosyltransferase [uncultured Ferrimonas sp.]|uniref:glycosyltransferase n=1 Tax=uncultured Ferrimonas sp. TaxID=432640 RepID=UPI00261C435C|nr:glycosyltransferase [uncultured Ferrimonas sp.]